MFADIKSFPFPTQSFTSFSLNLFNFIFIYLFILFYFLIAAICLTNSTLSRLVARTVYWWPLRVKLFVQCLVSTPSRRVYLRPQVAVTCHLVSANIFSFSEKRFCKQSFPVGLTHLSLLRILRLFPSFPLMLRLFCLLSMLFFKYV